MVLTTSEPPAEEASSMNLLDAALATIDSVPPSHRYLLSSLYFRQYKTTKNIVYLHKSILIDEWIILGQVEDKASFLPTLAQKYSLLYDHTLSDFHLNRALGNLHDVVMVPPSIATIATGSGAVKPGIVGSKPLSKTEIEAVDQTRLILRKLWKATRESEIGYLQDAIASAEHWLLLTSDKKENTDSQDQSNSKQINEARYAILREALVWVTELQAKSASKSGDVIEDAALVARYILALTSTFAEEKIINIVLPEMPPRALWEMGKALSTRYQEYCNAPDAEACLHMGLAMLRLAMERVKEQKQKDKYMESWRILNTLRARRFGKLAQDDHHESRNDPPAPTLDTTISWNAHREAMAKFTEYRNFGGHGGIGAEEKGKLLDQAIALSRDALKLGRSALLDEKAKLKKDKDLPRIDDWSRNLGEMVLRKLQWCDETGDPDGREKVKRMVKEELDANSAEEIISIKPQARTMSLVTLAQVLYKLYQRDPDNNKSMFEEALKHANAVLDIVKGGLPKGTVSEKAARNALSTFYMSEYESSGKASELDAAIKHMMKSLKIQKPHQEYGLHGKVMVRFKTIAGLFIYLEVLNTLAAAYAQRYRSTENYEDLEKAVHCQKKAVQYSVPDRLLKAGYQVALSGYLIMSYESGRVTVKEDQETLLNDALSQAKEAWRVLETDGEPQRKVECLLSMTSALQARYMMDKEQYTEDKGLAIGYLLEATTVEENPNYNTFSKLDEVRLLYKLSKIYELSDEAQNRNMAGWAAATAVQECPANLTSFRAELLYNQAQAMRNFLGDITTPDDILSVLKECFETPSALPLIRLKAAAMACYLLGETKQWKDLYKTASDAMELFSLLPITSLAPRDQQKALHAFSGFGPRAAAAALECGVPPGEALRLLEQGRDIIARQRFDIRTDLTKLTKQHKELAIRFKKFRDVLDNTGMAMKPVKTGDANMIEDKGGKRLRATKELQQVVEEIRLKPGFEGFLKPSSVEAMKEAAADGAIVVINVTEWRCDAFIIPKLSKENHEIEALRLDKLSQKKINQSLRLQNPDDETNDMEQPSVINRDFLDYLWTAIADPVLQVPILHCTKDLWAEPKTPLESYPRIWWCCTGTASRLPLHAASSKYDIRKSVMRRVVSSYTSSIKALIFSRGQAALRRSIPPNERGRTALLCSVSMTEIKDGPWGQLDVLQNAGTEVEKVQEIITKAMQQSISGPAATLLPNRISEPKEETLIFNLNPQRSSDPEKYPAIFHFAGHGYSDPNDPSKSCLITTNSPLEVWELMGVKIYENAPVLAYLSACSTGVNLSGRDGAGALTDEGIHLMGTMQLVGFLNVVGALWQVGDTTSRRVARIVYERWLSTGKGGEMRWEEEGELARCLHHAVMELRYNTTNGVNPQDKFPISWAPFIHMGV